MGSSDDDARGRHRARIEDERKRISALDDNIATQLNKIILAGSIGGILASISFVKDIAPWPTGENLVILLISWGLLFISAVSGVGMLSTSRVAGKYSREVLHAIECETDNTEAEEKNKLWNTFTRRLQATALIGLGVGACLLLVFAGLNLYQKTKMNDEKKPQQPPAQEPTPLKKSIDESIRRPSYDMDTTSNPFLQKPKDNSPKKEK
jgi:hypothetical protein